MKIGFGISIGGDIKNPRVHLNSVVSQSRLQPRLLKSENFPFVIQGDATRTLSQTINFRVMQQVVQNFPKSGPIPVMIGIQGSLFEELGGDISNKDQYDDFCGGLGLGWTELLRTRLGPNKRVQVRPGTYFVDRNRKIVSNEFGLLPDEEKIRGLVRLNKLDELKQQAYTDGGNVMRYYTEQLGASGVVDFRFAIFGVNNPGNIRHTYLNTHPELKQEFVRGMMDARPLNHQEHHFCIKTTEDDKAPHFADIISTILADMIAEEQKETRSGHVQTILT